MALNKVTYVDGKTIIAAKNLNDIQDEIIEQGALKGAANGIATLDPNGKVPMTQLPLADVISNAVEEWLDENVASGETLAIDKSLTIEGAAADAKKTGDELSALKQKTDNIQNVANLEYVTVTE